MTDVDESLLTIAKLREVLRGELDVPHSVHRHGGLVEDGDERAVHDFLESAVYDRSDTLDDVLQSSLETEAATKAAQEGMAELAAYVVGVTETDYDGSALSVTLTLLERIANRQGGPSVWTIAGNPDTGKTNLFAKLVEMIDDGGELIDELPTGVTVLSNVRTWERTDVLVTSMHDLVVESLRRRDEPKVVFVDEGSTHFDARTYNYEVAAQFTPAAKRFAKVGIEMFGTAVHTGKDAHPELKRLTTTAGWKEEQTTAQFYERWPADADRPDGPIFTDLVKNLEKAEGYDPDDAAPWAWNLQAGLFQHDLDWPELLEQLEERGPED